MTVTTLLHPDDVADELDRAIQLIRSEAGPEDPVCVLVSGGLDSDVVARLAAAAVSSTSLKLVTVLQDEMSPTHLGNARSLAEDLGVKLVELDLRGVNIEVVYRLSAADPFEAFDPTGLLDPARMKCSVRTVVASSYQDRGYVILGASNRTERDLGFFLPFGDGIWHVGPIAHLYKTEVRLLASALGTASNVCSQPPSAGFWTDQTDREDLGFWLVNGGPIQRQRAFSDEEERRATALSERLDETAVDELLLAIASGEDPMTIAAAADLGADLVEALLAIVERSARLKNRPVGTMLARSSGRRVRKPTS